MKPVYSNIALQPGVKNPGIYKVQIAPREWLQSGPVINFNTGSVTTAVTLVAGRAWLELDFAPVSHEFEHRPKSSKAGPYNEIAFTGLLNILDAATLQVLETIRYHEVVMIVTDRNKKKRLAGDDSNGMVLAHQHKITNQLNGQETIQLSFLMEAEDSAPFYTV